MNNSNPNTSSPPMSRLFDVFLDEYRESDEKELFSDDGIDTDSIVEQNLNLFLRQRTMALAELNRNKHDRAVIFLDKLRSGVEKGKEIYKTALDKLSSSPQLSGAHSLFRNLTSLSEHDKQSIVSDATLLDILNDLEDEIEKNAGNE